MKLSEIGESLTKVRQRNTPHWWSEVTEKLIKEKKIQYNKWLSTRDAEDRRQYYRINAEVKRTVAITKNENWQKACQNIDNYIGNTTSKEAWKLVRSLKTNRKETSGIQLINAQEWLNHYEDLLVQKRPQFLNNEPATDLDISCSSIADDEITAKEIKEAVKVMKNNCFLNSLPIFLMDS